MQHWGRQELGGPVPWLLSRQLLSELASIILYELYRSRMVGLDWMRAEDAAHPSVDFDNDEVWFDYFADSGDSQRATYWVARMLLAPELVFGKVPLPRGQFAVFGGDTSYHTADVRTIANRFSVPFARAYAATGGVASASRPIYAIPGNHDYYDWLHGFNRQFRRRVSLEGTPDDGYPGISGFQGRQEASYFAIQLKHWTIVGLDAQNGAIDFRQQVYFREVIEATRRRNNGLILCTPEPSTVFAETTQDAFGIAKTLDEIGLSLPGAAPPGASQREPSLVPSPRLDIAGDTHHYARYVFPEQGNAYASLVSGLGGAFLHPPHTHRGRHEAKHPFPTETESTTLSWCNLLNPLRVARSGGTLVAAAVVVTVLFVGACSRPDGGALAALVPGPEGHWRGTVWAGGLPASATLLASGALGFIVFGNCLLKRHLESVEKVPDRIRRPVEAYALLLVAVIGLGISTELEPRPSVSASAAIALACAASGIYFVYSAVWHSTGLARAALARRSVPLRSEVWTKRYDTLIAVLLLALGLFAVVFGFRGLGDAPASPLIAEWAVLFVLLLIPGSMAFAAFVGGTGFNPGVKVGFGLVGVIHGIAQIALPLVLVQRASFWVVIAFACCLAGVAALTHRRAPWFARKPQTDAGLRLLLVLVATVALGMGIPFAVGGQPARLSLAESIVTMPIIAAFSVVWLGWYLAICLAFGGHNNEAGSAMGVDRFVQFIRFRATKGRLDAFVIGADTADTNGIVPTIIDQFSLYEAGASGPPHDRSESETAEKPGASHRTRDPGE